MSINKVFDVALDIKRPSSHNDFTVINGDNGNRIHITLTDGDHPVDISQCRVIAAFSRPDGCTSLQDSGMQYGGVTICGDSGNEIDISLFPASFSPGMVECELQIYSDGALSTLVTTARFNFSCRKAIVNEDTVQASPEYPLLRSLADSLQNSADGLAELMQEVQSAESARELAEAQRQQAAARFTNLSAEVNVLSSDAEPSASVTDTENGKHISLGIPAGPKGDTGDTGEKGDTGDQGPQGEKGTSGVTFTPAVSEDGTLSWSNDGGLDNPSAVNIMGPSGSLWVRETHSEPITLNAQDRHEYYVTDVSSIIFYLPEDTYYEFWAQITMSASTSQHNIYFLPSTPAYIGKAPVWQPSGIYELSVKNGICVARGVGEDV